jgi:adenylate kinase
VLNIWFSAPAELEASRAAGGELVQRADDNEETIGNRLRVYRDQTEPLVQYYRASGLLREVDGEGSTAEVYARLRAVLGPAAD